jgi:hypothetical protein
LERSRIKGIIVDDSMAKPALMSIGDRILLTWNYGKAQFFVGAVYNVFCTLLLKTGFSYSFFVDAFILKAIVSALTYYLTRQFQNRDAIFFYINLGLSRRKLQLSVLLIDYLVLAILLTSVLLLYGKA